MGKKVTKKSAIKNVSRGTKKVENASANEFIGFGQPPFGGLAGIPGGQTFQPVEDTTTMFTNLRWYLISNFRQVLSQGYVELGLIQTIVNVPIDDGLRGGVLLKSRQLDESQIRELQISLDRDDDINTCGWAAKWNRLYGGAGILILTDDQDPEEPFDISKITKDTDLEFRAVDMWELFWDKQNTEGYDPQIQAQDFEFYSYYSENIHKSRVMRLKSIQAPSFIRPRLRGWGVSVVEALVRSINQYLKATDLGFEVLDEFKIDYYKLKNLASSLLSPNGFEKTARRIQNMNLQKNYNHAVVMDTEDDFIQKQLSFAGLAEAMDGIRMQVAADMRMPITKLFGTSVSKGFATDQNDMENYNSMVESEVRNKLKYDILRICEIKCQKLFGFIPDDMELEFKPLRELSAIDQETVRTQKFTRLQAAADTGRISLQEYRDAANKGNLFDIQLDTTEDGIDIGDNEETEVAGEEESRDPEKDLDVEDPGANREDTRKVRADINVEPTAPGAKKMNFKNEKKFEESKHPRADDGKFGKGGSSTTSKKSIKRDSLVPQGEVGTLLREHKEDFEKLGKAEPELKTAIYEWSRAGYQYARALQQGKKLKGEEKEIGESVLNGMHANFDKLPIYEGPLTRDLQFDDWDQALNVFKPGNTFETDAYSSFTAKEGYSNRKCRLIIEKNTKGRAVWGLSQAKDEAEVIVPKGQKYVIDKVRQNDDGPPYVLVYLKEVNE